jgi:2-polyprenyl-3-methyl-5-hydroxy-6-metoxy-1,4-benzoquinol methylase
MPGINDDGVITRSSAELFVCDSVADQQFRDAVRQQYPHSYEFESRYVEHEMAHIGQLFASGVCPVAGKEVLEFGCNIGATSIVLAHYGADVTAVDVSADSIELARLNARRYGMTNSMRFRLLRPGQPLPFEDGSFDVVTCNSVLEYVQPELLPQVQRELDRVLKPGGLLLVFGTSNRLSPIEPHSGKWFVNYIPRFFDRLLRTTRERGVSPWKLRRGFGTDYEDLLTGREGVQQYLELKQRMGMEGWRMRALRSAAPVLSASPLSIGLLLPFATVLLRKTAPSEGAQVPLRAVAA